MILVDKQLIRKSFKTTTFTGELLEILCCNTKKQARDDKHINISFEARHRTVIVTITSYTHIYILFGLPPREFTTQKIQLIQKHCVYMSNIENSIYHMEMYI